MARRPQIQIGPVSPVVVPPLRTLAGVAGLGDGMVEPGNIELYGRPEVWNPEEQGWSTVFSTGVGLDGYEVLLPRADEGRILSEEEAIAKYYRTGQHLGKFLTVDAGKAYADRLHKDYEAGKYRRKPK